MKWNWKRRRKLTESKLTLVGWFYLVVLAFITVGSILRNVNLLVLMAGLMYAPLILHWRSGNQLLRTLRGKRALPQRIYAGQSVTVPWTVTNSSRQMTAWNVTVEDQLIRNDPSEVAIAISPIEDTPVGFSTKVWLAIRSAGRNSLANSFWSTTESAALMVFDRVDGGQSRTGVWRVCFPRRGRYQVGAASIRATSPLGLSVSQISFPETRDFFVAPEIGRLSKAWHRRMQSFCSGMETGSRRRGMDQEEFFALRPWRSGDNIKHVHWRTSARHGQPIVKQFDQNHDRDLALVLDLWCPSHADSSAGDAAGNVDLIRQRTELALSFAATVLSRIGIDMQGRTTFAICGQTTHFLTGVHQLESVGAAMRALAIAQPAAEPQLADSLLKVSQVISSGTPIFVISTRTQPLDLMRAPKKSAAVETPGGMEPDEALPTSAVRDSLRSKQFQRLHSLLAWLPVHEAEFASLFSAVENRVPIPIESPVSQVADA